jgi:hypothetical protein
MIPHWVQEMRSVLVRVEDEPEAVADWKAMLLVLINDQFSSVDNKTGPIWLARSLDPRFSGVGITTAERDALWETIVTEHMDLKEVRGRLQFGDDYTLPPGSFEVASGYATMLRAELEKMAAAFTAKLASGKTKLNDMCPLDFYKAKCNNPRNKDLVLHYLEFAPTVCMELSSPGNTGTSERGVARIRRTVTPLRNLLSADSIEQEVLCSHFINSPSYSFERLIRKIALIQSELADAAEKRKPTKNRKKRK